MFTDLSPLLSIYNVYGTRVQINIIDTTSQDWSHFESQYANKWKRSWDMCLLKHTSVDQPVANTSINGFDT